MMKGKGFIFTLDAMYAIIVIVIISALIFLPIKFKDARMEHFETFKKKLDDKAITNNYLGITGNKVDLVFLIDTSATFIDEWTEVCTRIDDIKGGLIAADPPITPNITIYGLPPVDPETRSPGRAICSICIGSGNATDEITLACKDTQDGCQINIPGQNLDCLEQYSGLEGVQYDPSMDASSEAWGLGGVWVLNPQNHNWTVGTRAIFIVGDHDPTGGTGAGTEANTWRSGIESEVGVVDELISRAKINDVNIFILHSTIMEYKATNKYPEDGVDNGVNDAIEIMEYTTDSVGGETVEYSQSSQIIPAIIGLVESLVLDEEFEYCSSYLSHLETGQIKEYTFCEGYS